MFRKLFITVFFIFLVSCSPPTEVPQTNRTVPILSFASPKVGQASDRLTIYKFPGRRILLSLHIQPNLVTLTTVDSRDYETFSESVSLPTDTSGGEELTFDILNYRVVVRLAPGYTSWDTAPFRQAYIFEGRERS